MKFKYGSYTGEKYSDGSLRIWKDGRLVGELYISVSQNMPRYCFTQKHFENLCAAIEANCQPYKGGYDDDTM